jgi:hypothetical protein
MAPKDRDSLWERFYQFKPSYLIDRILVRCVMFFLDLGLAFYGDGSKERLSLEHSHGVSQSHLTD